MNAHVSVEVLGRYAASGSGLDDATVWSLETHLESCSLCRERLSTAVDAGTLDVLGRVRMDLDRVIQAKPSPVWRGGGVFRGVRRWVWGMLPWLFMTAGMLLLTALVLELSYPGAPSFVLLIAPLAPLPAVAVANRRIDPAWEMVAASPRAGLAILLRRTLAVLVVVIPVQTLVGWAAGLSPAMWLLPALAFTTANLMLGDFIGMTRAAVALAGAWSLVVIAPALASERLPILLQPRSLPGWAVVTVAGAVLVLARADSHRRLASRN